MRIALPDWRRDTDYRPLAICDRALIAWEWLRRDPAYQAAFAARAAPSAFGLVRLEDPGRSVPDARPIWSHGVDPAVLRVLSDPSVTSDRLAFRDIAADLVAHHEARQTFLLLSDGAHSLRIDLEGPWAGEPIAPVWHVAGMGNAVRQRGALARLIRLADAGRWPAPTRVAIAANARLVRLLRIHDALAAGASQREIALMLFGPGHVGTRWRIEAPEYRARVQRYCQATRRIAADGAAALLV